MHRIFTIVFTAIVGCNAFSQLPVYTLSSSHPYYNPAFAASQRCPSLSGGFSFYPKLNYGSGFISADAIVFSNHGLSFISGYQHSSEKYFSDNLFRLNYSYTLPLSRRLSLKGGLYGSFHHHSYTGNIPFYIFSPAHAGNILSAKNKTGYFDAGAGLLLFGKEFYTGVSLLHALKPVFMDNGYKQRLHPVLSLQGMMRFGKTKQNSFSSVSVFQTSGALLPGYTLSFFYERNIKEKLVAGTGILQVEDNSFYTLRAGIKLFYDLTVFYQYNRLFTNNSEGINNKSGHEASISYRFNCKPKKRSFRTISCPSFGGGSGFYRGANQRFSGSAESNATELQTGVIADTLRNTEEYEKLTDNPFKQSWKEPVSTFSADVDNASYTNVRRMLNAGQKVDPAAVRIEEFLNYFDYDYPQPHDKKPFSVTTEYSDCPWNSQHKLLLIGIKGKNVPVEQLPPSHLVFLVDVSGSMNNPAKLPLLKNSLKLLLPKMRQQDKISIVTYEEKITTVIENISATDTTTIIAAIDSLKTGGGTNGGEGLQTAYALAEKYFIPGGNNRIILATDGDFNIGISDDKQLTGYIGKKRKSGIYLSVLGFGYGNYKDSKMEKISNNGNGNYAYIDDIEEARKTLVNEFGGTMFTIANDVKLQAEFNPLEVEKYRLIGYENRMLNKEDFANDTVDAGDIGINHTVTALYEIIPVNEKQGAVIDTMNRINASGKSEYVVNRYARTNNELLVLKLRYKNPGDTTSLFISTDVYNTPAPFENSSENFRFAASVASFGMLLRNSPYKGNSDFRLAETLAKGAVKYDPQGSKKEYLGLLQKAEKTMK